MLTEMAAVKNSNKPNVFKMYNSIISLKHSIWNRCISALDIIPHGMAGAELDEHRWNEVHPQSPTLRTCQLNGLVSHFGRDYGVMLQVLSRCRYEWCWIFLSVSRD